MRRLSFLALCLIPACAPQEDKESEIVKSPTKAEFNQLIEKNAVVLVDFQAEWCGPCKTMKPIVRGLERDYRGKLKVIEVDIDLRPELARAYSVDSIPRFFIFRDGKVDRVLVGAGSRLQLVEAVEAALKGGGRDEKADLPPG